MDGINGVSTSYSSFVPSRFVMKRRDIIDSYFNDRMSPPVARRTRNLRFAQSLCGAQNLSEHVAGPVLIEQNQSTAACALTAVCVFQASSVTAIIGFGAAPWPGFILKL